MTISKSLKIWIIINSAILSIVAVFFILGILYPKNWVNIIDLASIITLPLFLHIFYQGFYIGGFVAAITLIILIMQIYNTKTSTTHIPTKWLVGEIFIILVGILDILPITSKIIGNLYYIIPGW